jgi:hypothetical protein
MNRRSALLGAVLTAAILLPACNRKKSYDSPQAVFDAASAANAKEDWPAVMNCLTDESQDKLTFAMAAIASFMKGFAGLDKDHGKEVSQAIDDAMKKHGLTEEHQQKLSKGMFDTKGGSQDIQSIRQAIAPIKDKPGFVGDIMAAMKKFGNKQGDQQPQQFAGTLKDVKIDGDKATGTVVRTVAGKEISQPMEFRKVGGGWKIEISDKPMGMPASK